MAEPRPFPGLVERILLFNRVRFGIVLISLTRRFTSSADPIPEQAGT